MSDKKQLFKTKIAKDWLRGLLHSGDATITFIKKDGTEREMLCTLNETVIPQEKMPKGTGKEKNDDVLAVYDIEKQEWRSFRYDSITRIQANI